MRLLFQSRRAIAGLVAVSQAVCALWVLGGCAGPQAAPATAAHSSVSCPTVVPLSADALARAQAAPEIGQALALKQRVGHRKDAAALLRSAADGNNPVAQYELGHMYLEGKGGVFLEPATAHSWYMRAAENGYARGEVALGKSYHRGEGVVRNLDLATCWYHQAYIQGDLDGQALYGLSLVAGEGVPKDQKQGLALLKDAQDRGNQTALEILFLNLDIMRRLKGGLKDDDVHRLADGYDGD